MTNSSSRPYAFFGRNQSCVWAAGLLSLALASGCNGSTDEDEDDDETTPLEEEESPTPQFPEGTGQELSSRLAYPDGPFGFDKGSIIQNFKFAGFANSLIQNSTLEPLELAMFYNPTGDGVYPEGSLMGAGNPMPKALLINVGSVWCGPCNIEAKDVLPIEYAKYKPLGGEFLLQLADGPTPGVAAEPKHLASWNMKYDVDYPSTVDPTYKLEPLFKAAAYPQNFIIDTRTMEIARVIAGTPDAAFWGKFEQVLEE